MPDGFISAGPYRSPPSHDDEGVLRPIREGRPENINGLSWSRPDFAAQGHKIIRSFSIDRKKRPGLTCIPCAICSGSHPKFLDGAVLWSPDGWLRVIGHVCAARPEHFGQARYSTLKRQREQEELDGVALLWVENNIKAFRPLIAVVNRIKESAVFWERQQHLLFRNVPGISQMLEDAVRKHGGNLTVVDRISGTRQAASAEATGSSGSRVQSLYEFISLWTLEGAELLKRPRVKWTRQLESIVGALERIPAGSGDDPMLELFDQGEHGVTITAGVVFRAIQRALRLANKLGDAERFLTSTNLDALETWGRDGRNTVRFTLQRASSQITFIQEDRSRATLSLHFPKLPDLSKLNALASAGMQLERLLPK